VSLSRGRTATNSLDGECMMQNLKVPQSHKRSHPHHSEARSAKQAHSADSHVGRQVALLRLQFRMTQVQLAKGIGISIQQLQKYESAKNRVSASMLFEIATFFNLPVSRLFEGLPGNGEMATQSQPPPDRHIAFLASVEGRRVNETLLSLPPRLRRRVSSLVTALSEELLASQSEGARISIDPPSACGGRDP
jgi:transcriptional regulator with XRE-family HTH domain